MEQKLNTFLDEVQLRNFFNNPANQKYWYLTYEEFLEVFGKESDPDLLDNVRKYLAETHVSYFNLNYELLWNFKWWPIFTKLTWNLGNIIY